MAKMSSDKINPAAFEMAEGLFKSACEGTTDQMNNQIAILNVAAMRILGCVLANQMVSKGWTTQKTQEWFQDTFQAVSGMADHLYQSIQNGEATLMHGQPEQ